MEEVKNVVANENFDWNAFENDLGADSLDLVELSMALEEEFGVEEMSEEDVAAVKTVGDLVRYLQSKLDD